MDNRKMAQVEAITETPEVQAARLAHQRAWEAAAKAAKENPDPMSDIYNANANKLDEEQSEIDQAMEIISGVTNQRQPLARYPSVEFNNNQIKSSDDSVIVSAAESRRISQYERIRRENEEEKVDEEPQGEPRGFFYNIDYPVQLLVGNVESGATHKNLKNAKNLPTQKVNAIATDPQFVAESAQFKIVPIRILDAKKYKRSGERRRKATAAMQKSAEEKSKIVVRSAKNEKVTAETQVIPSTQDTPIEQIHIAKVTEATLKQVPVHVRAETNDKLKEVKLDDLKESEPSEIIKIKSIAEQELELKRLATNADLIDAVHDAQIHPKQSRV